MVCVIYIQQIYFFQHSFSYFIYLSYFVKKKKEIRVKLGHLPSVCSFFSVIRHTTCSHSNRLKSTEICISFNRTRIVLFKIRFFHLNPRNNSMHVLFTCIWVYIHQYSSAPLLYETLRSILFFISISLLHCLHLWRIFSIRFSVKI